MKNTRAGRAKLLLLVNMQICDHDVPYCFLVPASLDGRSLVILRIIFDFFLPHHFYPYHVCKTAFSPGCIDLFLEVH